MIKRIAKIIQDGVVNGDSSWDEIAYNVIQNMKPATDDMQNKYYRMKLIAGYSNSDSIFSNAEWERMIDSILKE